MWVDISVNVPAVSKENIAMKVNERFILKSKHYDCKVQEIYFSSTRMGDFSS